MQSIHCKASLDDQYRRFLFKFSQLPSESGAAPESQFNKLHNQIRSLYGIGVNFVLKYKDDEGDHIIIESEEEFYCAVAQSAGLLRLFIKLKDEQMMADVTTTITTSKTTTPTTASENTYPYHCGRYGYHGRGGHQGRGSEHWHRGRHGHEHGRVHGHGQGIHHQYGQNKAAKLTSKRDYIASLLNDPQLNTDEFRKLKLQRKLECIDRRLAVVNSTDQQESFECESSGEEKWRKKKCDKYSKKYHGKDGKRPRKIRRNLTEDEKVILKVLKSQIWELKPILNSVKIQLGEKKALKADAKKKGDMQRVEELKKEIQQLKEIKKEQKKAIAPLKCQIRALKFEKEEC